MVIIPAGFGANNKCADEGQQQFTRPDPIKNVERNKYMVMGSGTLNLD
jgi:hypothetical protein